MRESEYKEEDRLKATCNSCGSDRVYITNLLAIGGGLTTVVKIECADCTKSGQAWDNPDGAGLEMQWDGSDEILIAEYLFPDTPPEQ